MNITFLTDIAAQQRSRYKHSPKICTVKYFCFKFLDMPHFLQTSSNNTFLTLVTEVDTAAQQ